MYIVIFMNQIMVFIILIKMKAYLPRMGDHILKDLKFILKPLPQTTISTGEAGMNPFRIKRQIILLPEWTSIIST